MAIIPVNPESIRLVVRAGAITVLFHTGINHVDLRRPPVARGKLLHRRHIDKGRFRQIQLIAHFQQMPRNSDNLRISVK